MSTATYFSISLPIFIGFAALSIDYGLMTYSKAQLQTAADTSAISSAAYLGSEDDGSNNTTTVSEEATSIATSHTVYGATITSENVTTEIGTFNQGGEWILDMDNGDYVKITTESNIPSIFGGMFGYYTYHVHATSIAGKVATLEEECVPTNDGDWPCLIFANSQLELSGNFDLRIDEVTAGASACTNSGGITLGGSLNVQNGIDIHMGPDCEYDVGTPCIDSRGSAYNFTGDSTPMGMEIPISPVDYPESYHALPNGVRVGRGSNTTIVTTLQEGEVYYVDGDLEQRTAREMINISGTSDGCTSPTILYVNGNVNLNGGVTGNADHPECFEIRVIGERVVRINGSSTFNGTIYAPESTVYPNGNASFYGSIVADVINANGNHNITLASGLSSQVPRGDEEQDCEITNVSTTKLRIVQ
jgi:hypothetical protein